MAFICRFAPSPTGPLHIGGVRTALFNWLLAKKNKGKFYLRIEDTDKERSKDEFKKQIIESLSWVGIKHDDKEFIQSKNINKHKEIAEELLKKGFAYKCYCSEEEINEQKEKCKKQGIPYVYNRKWREAKDVIICFLNSSLDLSLSVSSILRKYFPLFFLAKSQLNKAVRTPPI